MSVLITARRHMSGLLDGSCIVGVLRRDLGDLGFDGTPSRALARGGWGWSDRAVFILLSATLLLGGCKEEVAAVRPDPVVRTMRVALAPDEEVRTYTGVIRARHEVEEAFRVGGRVVERPVDVGATVKAGQVLARLDPQDLELQVGSAEAELRAARSALAQTGADEARVRELKVNGTIAQADYDRRKLAFEEARGRLDRAERALSLARNQRDYATLVSSADGVVTAVHVEAGRVVGDGDRIVTMARAGAKEIDVAIPESRMGDLETARAEVTLWSGADTPLAATLREVAPQADPATRTYAVRFSLPQADAGVRLGMTATLRLARGAAQAVAKLPLTAVLNQGTGPGVFVVDPETRGLKLAPVTVERYGEAEAVVSSGLSSGDVVVTLGVQKLDAGLKVRMAEQAVAAR